MERILLQMFNFMRDLPDREMDKAFFFFKLNIQTKIKM